MALYDYECSGCKAIHEISKRISNRDTVDEEACPNCGKIGTLNRIVSAPLISYTTTVPGSYGRSVPDGFKEVLRKIHKQAPGSNLDKTSSYM